MAKSAPFNIEFEPEAQDDLSFFESKQRREILESITIHLRHRPNWETNKIKRLRPNPFAEWELRLGDFRVLYDIKEADLVVLIQAVGEKRGNQLIVRGEEFHKHESD
jgi:mRNA-degrading endonuclease RelE of RelBE toxin-antitoxin system